MAKKEVRASDLKKINLAPETEIEDVQQCIGMILNTPRGSVPFMRGFGISTEYYGSPLIGEENDIVDEVTEQIETYETRAIVDDLNFEEDSTTGTVEYSVPISLASEEEEDSEEDE